MAIKATGKVSILNAEKNTFRKIFYISPINLYYNSFNNYYDKFKMCYRMCAHSPPNIAFYQKEKASARRTEKSI